MKKIVVYAISVLMIVGCLSCHKKEEKIYMPVERWDGHNFYLKSDGFPLSIIWFTGRVPHKGFCQAKEIKEIIERLESPEIEGPPAALPEARNKLCLFYYKGGEYVSRVAVIDFDIDENGVFLGPRGKSPALGKLLQEKEESGLKRYALYGVPGWDPLVTEEEIDRREASARYVQEYQKRREEAAARYELIDVPYPFKLVDITVDDLLNDTTDFSDGILIRRSDDPDPNHMMAVIGELRVVQPIVGHKINADKVFGYPWPVRVFEGFQKAERVKSPAVNEYDVIFLDGGDNRKGYVIKMAVDKKYVYGEGYRSKQLRKDFTKMGLFEKN